MSTFRSRSSLSKVISIASNTDYKKDEFRVDTEDTVKRTVDVVFRKGSKRMVSTMSMQTLGRAYKYPIGRLPGYNLMDE